MTYTKGPWKAASDHQPLLVVSQDKKRIADCTPSLGASNSEALANANLIIAAPDLLEACEALLDIQTSSYCEWCDQRAPKDDEGYLTGPVHHLDGCAVLMARAAIQKAKGEVPNV